MGGNFYYYLKNGFLVQVLEEECRWMEARGGNFLNFDCFLQFLGRVEMKENKIPLGLIFCSPPILKEFEGRRSEDDLKYFLNLKL